jgi:hypothetical protein
MIKDGHRESCGNLRNRSPFEALLLSDSFASSISSIFFTSNHLRTPYAQRSFSNPFLFNHFPTLPRVTEGEAASISCPNRTTHTPLNCILTAKSCKFCPFIFNSLQDAPSATPLLSSFCIVAGGWVPPSAPNGKEAKPHSLADTEQPCPH